MTSRPGRMGLESAPARWPLGLREVRLMSGLVLAFFVLTHFANHALGLFSLDTMEAARGWFNLLWRSLPGTVLLYGALLVHFALALRALHARRTLRMPAREAMQLVFGLSLPFLLIPHVTGTRIEYALTGHDTGYPEMVRNLWVLAPENGLRQVTALVIAWLHACLGIMFWLRPKNWFSRAALLLYTGALLVPVLALLGFAAAGREIAETPAQAPASSPPGQETLAAIRMGLYAAFGGLIAGTLAARLGRFLTTWRRRIRIVYPGGRSVGVPVGFSVLETSRVAGIAHLSVCGGRGRCSTCRVRILEGLSDLPPPSAQERATLARIGAGPGVRLACQLRPTHNLAVAPVLTAETGRRVVQATRRNLRGGHGQERDIAVLFCDLRGFTGLTERRLPFDTVFILNRYFAMVGEAVEDSGGHVDKFVGDGALALFGLAADPQTAARQALYAALRIREGIARLNADVASELDQPLRIAISLHAGPAIVGEMGYGQATSLTAVGDTINAASRLEGLAKSLDAELVVSEDLARLAGLDLSGRERFSVTVRGRAAPIDGWVVPYGDRIALPEEA